MRSTRGPTPVADAFLSLPAADRRDILETAAARLGRPAVILEKDVWICRVLQVLFCRLPPGRIGHEDTSTLLLVDVAVDDYGSDRETGDPPLRRDVTKTLSFNSPGTPRSLPTLGGQNTPPRNAAQFICDQLNRRLGFTREEWTALAAESMRAETPEPGDPAEH